MAATIAPTTISDFLFTVDPVINYNVTSERKWYARVKSPKSPRLVRKWRDFDLATLNSMGNGIFKQALEEKFDFEHCPHHTQHLQEAYTTPHSEAALQQCLLTSVQQTVNCALNQTQISFRNQKLLPQIPWPGILMAHGSEAPPILGNRPERGSVMKYFPDWAGCIQQNIVLEPGADRPQPQLPCGATFLPGDIKLRCKVDFTLLNKSTKFCPSIPFHSLGYQEDHGRPPHHGEEEEGSYKETYEGLRYAIAQLYTYCYYANCRYGYMITETQLLVVRIRPSSQLGTNHPGLSGVSSADIDQDFETALAEDGLLEYRVISYNSGDRGRLSVNLALWWLHLLAVLDNRIHWWYPDLKDMALENPDIRTGYHRR